MMYEEFPQTVACKNHAIPRRPPRNNSFLCLCALDNISVKNDVTVYVQGETTKEQSTTILYITHGPIQVFPVNNCLYREQGIILGYTYNLLLFCPLDQLCNTFDTKGNKFYSNSNSNNSFLNKIK